MASRCDVFPENPHRPCRGFPDHVSSYSTQEAKRGGIGKARVAKLEASDFSAIKAPNSGKTKRATYNFNEALGCIVL